MLQKGDVILTVDGHPTPSIKAYTSLVNPKKVIRLPLQETSFDSSSYARGKRSNSDRCWTHLYYRSPMGRAPATQDSLLPTT